MCRSAVCMCTGGEYEERGREEEGNCLLVLAKAIAKAVERGN